MLANISWIEYWLWVTVIFFAYYSFVFIYFYRRQIRQAFFKLSVNDKSELQNDSDLFAVVHALMLDIENSFRSVNRQTSRQQCLEILQKHISHYPQIKDTAFQKAVNNKLSELLHNTCSIQISEQELEAVWAGDD